MGLIMGEFKVCLCDPFWEELPGGIILEDMCDRACENEKKNNSGGHGNQHACEGKPLQCSQSTMASGSL